MSPTAERQIVRLPQGNQGEVLDAVRREALSGAELAGVSYILSYSRRQYVRFVESQDFTTTIREHVRAFEYLQVPQPPACTTT
jgi:transposase